MICGLITPSWSFHPPLKDSCGLLRILRRLSASWAVTPVFMLGGSSSRDYPITILFFTAFFFVMWIINIGYLCLVKQVGQTDARPDVAEIYDQLPAQPVSWTHAALYWIYYHVAPAGI